MVEFKWTSHLNNKVNKQFRVVRTMARRAPDDRGEIWRLPESRWAPLPAKNTSKRQLAAEKLSPNHLVGLFMTSSFIVSPGPCAWLPVVFYPTKHCQVYTRIIQTLPCVLYLHCTRLVHKQVVFLKFVGLF